MRNAWRWLGGMLATTAALAAAADPGVTATTILLGQSAAFTGPAHELGIEMRAGAMAYFQAVNAPGRVNGPQTESRSRLEGQESHPAAAHPDTRVRGALLFAF